MASYRGPGAAPRILGLLVLIVILAAGGSLWFDFLGLIDITQVYAPVLRVFGFQARTTDVDAGSASLLEQERLGKQQEALDLRAEELLRIEQELAERAAELERQSQELASREQQLDDRENSFNQRVEEYEDRRAVLEENVRTLTSMRPESAVAILEGYDDQQLIDTLRVTEELAQAAGEVSLVSVWLARLPAERVARIQRLMTIRPVN